MTRAILNKDKLDYTNTNNWDEIAYVKHTKNHSDKLTNGAQIQCRFMRKKNIVS